MVYGVRLIASLYQPSPSAPLLGPFMCTQPVPFGGHSEVPTGGFVGAVLQPSVTNSRYLPHTRRVLGWKGAGFEGGVRWGGHFCMASRYLALRGGSATCQPSASAATAVPVSAMNTCL